jgi:hypothetical protein
MTAAAWFNYLRFDAMSQGLVQCPVHVNSADDFPVIQYVDDTLLVMPADPTLLQNLIDELAISTGFSMSC